MTGRTSSEWKRFVANAPEAQIEYRTIEIWHWQLDQVYRYVDAYNDMELIIEDGAPRDENKTVTFTASSLQIVEPAEREDSEQALAVSFGNVDGTIHRIVDQISGAGFFGEVDVVYRKYYSGDISQPATPPLYLFASELSFNDPTVVTFTAEDTDLTQKRAGENYTIEQFPGLRE